ncbi:MAG: glycosyltransferase, partial [Gemmatimonadetes bacterium]|nr:glycosyltransferase [Gemmatimonadota bacterium]
MSTGARAPSVAIAIATYRRPAMLAGLLESLSRAAPVRVQARAWAVVVDNDGEGSAREVVDAWRARMPFDLAYDVEPERNISLARNRAVRHALANGADFVAFVDDDEAVSPQWLDELLLAQGRTGADVVAGPVHPRHPPSTPGWMVTGGFFHRPSPPDGQALVTASTSNVLVSAALLAGPAPFAPAFGVSGGGDSLFFTGAYRRGARLVWAARAAATETVPPTRTRAAWILRRAFRMGNGAIWVERALEPPLRRVGERTAKGLVRLLFGVAILPVSLLRGRRGAVSALWHACYGAGCLAALAGYRYVEYRR